MRLFRFKAGQKAHEWLERHFPGVEAQPGDVIVYQQTRPRHPYTETALKPSTPIVTDCCLHKDSDN